MTANLQPGEYDMTCGLLTNPKGKLIVKGEATADAAKGEALLSLGELPPIKPMSPKRRRTWLQAPKPLPMR
jgi:iron uptake system EfeUOB component EfeO/EfeM